jgi:hypothetical protein
MVSYLSWAQMSHGVGAPTLIGGKDSVESPKTSRLGLATSHPWELVSREQPARMLVIGQTLNEDWLALSVTRSLGSAWQEGGQDACEYLRYVPRSWSAHDSSLSKYLSNISQRRYHSLCFILDLFHSLARSDDARQNARTTQTSLWRGSARSLTFDQTHSRASHKMNIASDWFPSAKLIAGNDQNGHGALPSRHI